MRPSSATFICLFRTLKYGNNFCVNVSQSATRIHFTLPPFFFVQRITLTVLSLFNIVLWDVFSKNANMNIMSFNLNIHNSDANHSSEFSQPRRSSFCFGETAEEKHRLFTRSKHPDEIPVWIVYKAAFAP